MILFKMTNKYSEETINKVKELLSFGFNSVEIGKKLNIHEVTVRNIKLQLKVTYSNRDF